MVCQKAPYYTTQPVTPFFYSESQFGFWVVIVIDFQLFDKLQWLSTLEAQKKQKKL